MIQPKTTDKLTDKAFSRLMLMSILWIFVTLVSLCSLTWAWYSTNVSSSQNTLRAATSSAAITVLDSNGSALPIAGQNAQGQDVYVFEANTPYTVTLTIGENDTANAYCSLVINDFPYHSEPLLASSVHNSLSFQIEFTQKQVGVQVLPRWGILNGTYTFEDLCAYKDLAKVDHSMLTTEEESEETTEGADETVESPAETEGEPQVDTETTESPAETEQTLEN